MPASHSRILRSLNLTPSGLANYRIFSIEKANLNKINYAVKKIPAMSRLYQFYDIHLFYILFL